MAKRIKMTRLDPSPSYRRVWRIVDGAVQQALDAHPEYIAKDANIRAVRISINKRVAGAVAAALAAGARLEDAGIRA
jgi:hypothetical protein